MAKVGDLADLRNHLYERAEWLWQVSVLVSFSMLLLTVIGLWSRTRTWVVVTGCAALVLPIALSWIRETAVSALIRGDKCRRLILYGDGLGQNISPAQLAEVQAWAAGQELAAAPFSPPYYSSKRPPGPQRLADIVTESAFFTEYVAARLQTWLWIAFGIALGVSVVALYFADLATGLRGQSLLLAAKSIAVFIAFLISGDFALLAKKYGDLRHESRVTYQRCARLREQTDASVDDVRLVVEDYGVALLQCPPIPSWLYARYRDALNDIYRESHGRPGV